MDENDLHGLADEPMPEMDSHRPVESIIERGEQLRRRRMVLRSMGTTALAAAVLVVGVSVWPDPPAEVKTDDGGPPQTYPEGTSNAPYFLGCDGSGSGEEDPGPGADLPPEATDGLRFLPTWLPEGMTVDRTAEIPTGPDSFVSSGESDDRITWRCRHSDPALVLRATGGDDTVEAGIKVEGPYANAIDLSGLEDVADVADQESTELRGVPAIRLSDRDGETGRLAFTWTEPDGAAWWIEGTGTDEETIRVVAEALRLESAPPDGTPAVDLASDAVPTGFELVWRSPGLPAVADPERVTWSASFAFTACYITFQTGRYEAPAGMREVAGGGAGTVEVTVRGKPGLVTSYGGGPPTGGTELMWQEGPDVVGRIGCNNGIDPDYDPGIEPETLVRIADSLEPVEVDDPRFG